MQEKDGFDDLLALLNDGPSDAEHLAKQVSWDPTRLKAVDVPHGRQAVRTRGDSRTTLTDGREISLDTLYQYTPYRGVLCGIPRNLKHFVLEAIRQAEKLFPSGHLRPFFLTPTLRRFSAQVLDQDGDSHECVHLWTPCPKSLFTEG